MEKLNNFFFTAPKWEASESYHCSVIGCIIRPIVFSTPVHLLFNLNPKEKKNPNKTEIKPPEFPSVPKSRPKKSNLLRFCLESMMDHELYFCSGFEAGYPGTSQRDPSPPPGLPCRDHRVAGGQHVGSTAHKARHLLRARRTSAP